MVEVLSKHGAIIDKFVGDAIVARFDSGDPATDALNAGSWGLGYVPRSRAFQFGFLRGKGKPDCINSGEVILETWAARDTVWASHAMIGEQREYWAAAQSSPNRSDDFRDHLRTDQGQDSRWRETGNRGEGEKGKGGRLRSRRAQVAFPVTEESRR